MRKLTPRIAMELIAHEGIVREAYRDSVGVWTWSVGVTDASGHRVHPRYKDKPQTLEHCLAVYLWLLERRYLSPVLAAFGDHDPAEHELGAALSFHWNTGAIGRAAWLCHFLSGNEAAARAAFLDWARPPALLPRRRRERALFFDSVWTAERTALVFDVAKPSYRPHGGKRVEVASVVARLMATDAATTPQSATKSPSVVAADVGVMEPSLLVKTRTWFDRLFD